MSKAEGRTRTLAEVTPGERARRLAAELGKDPRLVELVLAESRRVVRAEAGVLIVETSAGWVCANAGIDSSNVPGTEMVTLLPVDADASARGIRAQLAAEPAARPGVVIADSFGRPWRLGQAEVAIGCAGVIALDDWRGRRDAEGRELAATAVAAADELAAAADLARSKDSREPAVLIRGAAALLDRGRRARSRRPAAPARARPVPLVAQVEVLQVVLAADRVRRALLGELGRHVRLARRSAHRQHPRRLVARDDLAPLTRADPDPDPRLELEVLATVAADPDRRPPREQRVDLLLVVVRLVVVRVVGEVPAAGP